MSVTIRIGDCREVLRSLPDQSVNCIVTSPPYFGLRDYGVEGQVGLEETPDAFVAELVSVFREARRVLKDDGTLWLNLGDSYAGGGTIGRNDTTPEALARRAAKYGTGAGSGSAVGATGTRPRVQGLKSKDLIGVPWMAAFALRADGWFLRSDIIWAKPNGMPESVTDRPTRAHEMVFLLSKSARYYYNNDALRTPAAPSTETRLAQDVDAQAGSNRANGGAKSNGTMKAVQRAPDKQSGHSRRHDGFNDRWDAMDKAEQQAAGANLKSVWWLSPAQFRESHFATMPTSLAEICIVGGCPVGGTVLDPFGGAGTTGLVADRLNRNAILIELNPEYAEMARNRINEDAPMFGAVA